MKKLQKEVYFLKRTGATTVEPMCGKFILDGSQRGRKGEERETKKRIRREHC